MAAPESDHDGGGDDEVTQDEFGSRKRRDAPVLRYGGFAQYRANAAAQPSHVEQAQYASEQRAQRHSPSRQKPSRNHYGADHDISIALKTPLDPTVVNLTHLRNGNSKLRSRILSNE